MGCFRSITPLLRQSSPLNPPIWISPVTQACRCSCLNLPGVPPRSRLLNANGIQPAATELLATRQPRPTRRGGSNARVERGIPGMLKLVDGNSPTGSHDTPIVTRPKLGILLILAFVATLFAPVRAGWACPDGTPCLAVRNGGFRCAKTHAEGEASCCDVRRLRCRHEAFPIAKSGRDVEPSIRGLDHCRFTVSDRSQTVALRQENGASVAHCLDLSLPQPAFEPSLHAAAPAWRSEVTLGYRPPPICDAGPPRAPPAA